MKKYLILFLTVLAFSFTSCDEDTEPGGTAVEKMAGDWWVTYQQSVDEYNYSLLAKKCGIEMPETRLFEEKYFGVERFDRTSNGKLHNSYGYSD